MSKYGEAEIERLRATIERVRALAARWDEESGDYVPPLPADAAWTVMRDHIDQVRNALDTP